MSSCSNILNPKQNYIKRYGLPNETLEIRHGDVYATPAGAGNESMIPRKPVSKPFAMRILSTTPTTSPGI